MRWRDRRGVLWEVLGFWGCWGKQWGKLELQRAGETGPGTYRCASVEEVAASRRVRHHRPMKTLLLLAALLVPSISHASPVSLGVAVTAPELFGVQASFYTLHELSVDARLTLATVDGGVTGHIPISGAWDGGLHRILVTAYLGYAHNLVAPVRWLPHRGLRIEALAGYGYLNGIDLRIQAGASIDPGYGAGFAGQVLVGWLL